MSRPTLFALALPTIVMGILVEILFVLSFWVWWQMLLELWPPFQWGFSRMELLIWMLEVLYPFFVIAVSVWGWWMVRKQKYARAVLLWLGSSAVVLLGSWWLMD